MIKNFRCKYTQTIFEGKSSKKFQNIKTVAERKLTMRDNATTIDFLRSPPGNQLEALTGDRSGQHSIRINKQWRICFIWKDDCPNDVEIVDYH